jgi:regulator of cell morphogenesis and NO signaling
MGAIDSTVTLGALVAERAGRAPLFERLHFDYCCGGAQTLGEACAERGLDVETVSAMLQALDADGPTERAEEAGARGSEEADWRLASLEELCAHVVGVHHERLRLDFTRIDQLLHATTRAHASSRPSLHELQRAFYAIRARLEPHLEREEQALFPRCIALERLGMPIEDELIDGHEDEHHEVGERLARLRELGDDYDTERALCGTHRALLEALEAFELSMHRHVHEENNVLFVRARELNAEVRAMRAARGGGHG